MDCNIFISCHGKGEQEDISCSSYKEAKRLYEFLLSKGQRPFLCEHEKPNDFYDEIQRAIDSSTHFILVAKDKNLLSPFIREKEVKPFVSFKTSRRKPKHDYSVITAFLYGDKITIDDLLSFENVFSSKSIKEIKTDEDEKKAFDVIYKNIIDSDKQINYITETQGPQEVLSPIYAGSSLTKKSLKYEFDDLTPFEFENVVHDISEKLLESTLDQFENYKHNNFEIRCLKTKDAIIQCKRCNNFSSLQSFLTLELNKIMQIKPKVERYILALSIELTFEQKKWISQLFSSYNFMVLDCCELNNILSTNYDIQKKYFKLFLINTEVKQKTIRSISNRAVDIVFKWELDLKKYVQNSSLDNAIKMLEKYKYCMIIGEPGIGKTMLAKALVYKYITNNFEPYVISSIKEALDKKNAVDMLGTQQNIIFYYDDFLGDTCQKIKNEDQDLINFFEEVKQKENIRFILTSRKYILSDALSKSDFLKRASNVLNNNYYLKLTDYNEFQKALILYNHLYYAEASKKIKKDNLDTILDKQRYKQIINHKNYNPRIIEYVVENYESASVYSLFDYFMQSLANPKNIWDKMFDDHFDESERLFLYSLSIFENARNIQTFQETYENLLIQKGIIVTNFQIFLTNCLKKFEGEFTHIDEREESTYVSFINPSIRDYLHKKLNDNEEMLSFLFTASDVEGATYIFNNFKTMKTRKGFLILFEKIKSKTIQEIDTLQNSINTLLKSLKLEDDSNTEIIEKILMLYHEKSLDTKYAMSPISIINNFLFIERKAFLSHEKIFIEIIDRYTNINLSVHTSQALDNLVKLVNQTKKIGLVEHSEIIKNKIASRIKKVLNSDKEKISKELTKSEHSLDSGKQAMKYFLGKLPIDVDNLKAVDSSISLDKQEKTQEENFNDSLQSNFQEKQHKTKYREPDIVKLFDSLKEDRDK